MDQHSDCFYEQSRYYPYVDCVGWTYRAIFSVVLATLVYEKLMLLFGGLTQLRSYTVNDWKFDRSNKRIQTYWILNIATHMHLSQVKWIYDVPSHC